MTAPSQARRRANFRGKRSFILATSVAALFSVSVCLDTARADLVVDSTTFEQNASNSYSGNTFIRSTTSSGTLNLNVVDALPSGTRSAVTLDDGTSSKGHSSINLNGFDQVAASLSSPNSTLGKSSSINLNGYNLTVGGNGVPTTFYGSFGSIGGLIKDGNNTQILAGNTSLLYTTITGGDLEIGTATTTGTFSSTTAVSVGTGGTFTLVKIPGSTFDTDVTNGLGGTGTFNIKTATTMTIVGRLSDGAAGLLGLTQSGTGKTILTNSNDYNGNTNVTSGELQIGTTTTASSIGAAGQVNITSGGKLTLVNVFTQVGAAVTLDHFTNNITNSGGGVGTLSINSTKTVTVSGDLTDSGGGSLAVSQDGTGTTILTGFSTYSGPTTVNHGTLQVGDGSGAIAFLFGSPVQVNAGTKFLVDGATLLGGVNLNATNVSLRAIQGAGIFNDIFSAITGSGSVIQDGAGTTTLTAANTYTGTTTVNAGILEIGSGVIAGASIASSGKVKVNGLGTLAVNLVNTEIFPNAVSLNSPETSVDAIASGTNTFSGVISGSGGFNQNGTGTAVLIAKETYTGKTTVNSGTLELGAGTAASLAKSSVVDIAGGGTFSLVNVVGNTFSNSVTNSGTGVGTFNGNSTGTITVSSVLADGDLGQLAVTQTGTGTTILTKSSNSYSGGTTITDGILQIGTTGAAGSIGTGGVNIAAGGALVVINIAGNTFSNDVTNDLGGVGTLVFNSAKTNTVSGLLTDGSAGQLALTQSGTGTTILANASNTYSEATTVSKGTLQIGTTSSAGSIGAASPISISNGARVNVVNLSGTLGDVTNGVGGVGTLAFNSAGVSTVTGALTNGASGTLAVTQSGTGTTVLTNGGSTYTGATTVSKGTLRIGTNAAAGSIGATSAVSVSNGAILNLVNVNGNTFANNVSNGAGGAGKVTVNSMNTTTLSGLLTNGASGTLALAQNGTGTTILTRPNTYSGGTTVSGGTLLVNNVTGSGTGTGAVTVNNNGTLGGFGKVTGPMTLNSGGTIAPGAGSPGVAGTILHGSSLTWNGGSTLSLQISSGSIEDALALSGALTKGTAGTFTLEITGNGVAGENYTLATFGSSTFTSANFKLELPDGYAGILVKTATSLTLDLTSTTVPFAPSGFTSHGAEFTMSSAAAPTLTQVTDPVATPEPGSAMLLAFGTCALLGWHRRRA